jgi:hypothetical protein
MTKKKERCGICGRLKTPAGCGGPHIESVRRLLRTVEREVRSDLFDELTPAERYSHALERRDTATPAKPSSPRHQAIDGSTKAPGAGVDGPSASNCPVCDVSMELVTETPDVFIYICGLCRLGLSVKRETN